MIFSCPHPLNANGPSRPLTRIAEAMRAKHGNDLAVFSPSMYDELSEPQRLGDSIGAVFDEVVAADVWKRITTKGTDTMFLGGGGASLRQMRVLHGREKLTKCGTLWFSSHWQYAQRVLEREYRFYGVQQRPIHQFVAGRAEKEQIESDYMIVPSERCKSTYPVELQDKIHVAEFGVDAEEFKPDPHKQASERLRVLFPATNPPRKGLRYVMEAWGKLDPARFQLTITGGFQAQSVPANMPPIVTTGWVPDAQMRAFYRSHDVLLLPSIEEGQALAALEAMACGLPVIVTPEVGLPVQHGQDGIITVSSMSSGAIVPALEAMAGEPDMVKRWGAMARQFAEQRPWSKFQDRVVEIVEKA